MLLIVSMIPWLMYFYEHDQRHVQHCEFSRALAMLNLLQISVVLQLLYTFIQWSLACRYMYRTFTKGQSKGEITITPQRKTTIYLNFVCTCSCKYPNSKKYKFNFAFINILLCKCNRHWKFKYSPVFFFGGGGKNNCQRNMTKILLEFWTISKLKAY